MPHLTHLGVWFAEYAFTLDPRAIVPSAGAAIPDPPYFIGNVPLVTSLAPCLWPTAAFWDTESYEYRLAGAAPSTSRENLLWCSRNTSVDVARYRV